MAQEDPQPQAQAQQIENPEDLKAKLAELGVDFQMGMDVQRYFVTGTQIFAGPELTLIVFREQNSIEGIDGQPDVVIIARSMGL